MTHLVSSHFFPMIMFVSMCIIPRELSGLIYYILGRERHNFSVVMLGEYAIGHHYAKEMEDFLNITLTHMSESYLLVWRC